MHEFVLLVDLLSVGLGCETCQALLIDVDAERLVARDNDIDSQVKLVAVDKERVRDVL